MSDPITNPLVVSQSWTVEGNIMSAVPEWFDNQKDLPAGYYQISYVGGAFKESPTQGWMIGSSWFITSLKNGAIVDLLACPSISTPQGKSSPTGLYNGQGYDTQDGAQTAFSAATPLTFLHSGGPLGVVLNDNPYTDNVHGSPDPTWKLSSLVPAPATAPTGCVDLVLYNTGTSRSGLVPGGTLDSNWALVQCANTPPTTQVYVLGAPISFRYPPNTNISQWLGPKSSGQYTSLTGIFIYRYTLDLSAYDPTTVKITGRWAADDVGIDIKVNGKSTNQTASTPYTFASFILSSNFIQGINTIDFVCDNTPTYPSVTAFRLEWVSGVACAPVITPSNPTSTTPASTSTIPAQTSSSSGPVECVKDTPTTGLLSAKYKAILDSLSSNPGGFGFIFRPGTYITHDYGVDSVMTGDIEFVSQSLRITQSTASSNGSTQNVFNFAVSPLFFSTFCIQIPGITGLKGPQGDPGPDGLDGVGVDGPQGDQGATGADATAIGTFTGVIFNDISDIYSSAVVSLSLDVDNSVLEVVTAPIAVPSSDDPARAVTATPIYRDITFSSVESMDKWELFAPGTDAVVAATGSSDINIIKLPDGWNGGEAGIVTQKLSQLITLIIAYYDNLNTATITAWDRQIKEYVASQDAAARGIIADLAQQLTECEWSSPIEFAIDISPDTITSSGNTGSSSVDASSVGTEPMPTTISGFKYDSKYQSNLHGSGTQFVYYSPNFTLNISGARTVTFNGGCDDIGMLLPTYSSITANGNIEGTGGLIIELILPIHGRTVNMTNGGTDEEFRVLSSTVTVLEAVIPPNSNAATVNSKLTAAGFYQFVWGTPITVGVLSALGLIDVYGNLHFKTAICPSKGGGRIHIDSITLGY